MVFQWQIYILGGNMKLTKQNIIDIYNACGGVINASTGESDIDIDYNALKEKGIEIEEPSKLEQARNHYEWFLEHYGFDDDTYKHIEKIALLYELAVKEEVVNATEYVAIECSTCGYYNSNEDEFPCSECTEHSEWVCEGKEKD